MTEPKPTRRLYPTPASLIYGLLVVEGLLWLSERYRWFSFNEHKGWTVAVVVVAVILMLLWFVASLLCRWRFQFSIRSLLVLTVAVAVPCSWLAVEMRAARRQRDAATAIIKMGGEVFYVGEENRFSGPAQSPPGPEWLGRLLGQDFVASVTEVDLAEPRLGMDELTYLKVPCPDAGLENLKGMPRLKSLRLDGSKVTDEGLEHVRNLSHLETLMLGNTGITDAGLEYLSGNTQLQFLDLDRTKVTDAGLECLKGLRQLRVLLLQEAAITDAGLENLVGMTQLIQLEIPKTKVTDAGLKYLAGLDKLEQLNLCGTQVTDDGVNELRQALPNCKVYH